MKLGYAASATDSGHTGSPGDAAWALGHPEKIIDFGYRGIHEMTASTAAAHGHLVEDCAERKNIGAGVHVFALDLLRRHVLNGANNVAGSGQRPSVRKLERKGLPAGPPCSAV